MNNILVIIAAGLSSRMNGMPKHLCKINNTYNIVNTIEKSKYFFDQIYVVLNKKLDDEFKNITQDAIKKYENANTIYIESGKGDADAVLKAFKHLDDLYLTESNFIFCWGDAYFKSSDPFKDMLSVNMKYSHSAMTVGVVVDKDPYAWFDVEDNKIVKSHFKKYESSIDYGIHDQCIFKTNNKIFAYMLITYAHYLGYDGNNYLNTEHNEMGLLNFITWLADTYKDLDKRYLARTVPITANKVVSFNTEDELKNLNNLIENESSSN